MSSQPMNPLTNKFLMEESRRIALQPSAATQPVVYPRYSLFAPHKTYCAPGLQPPKSASEHESCDTCFYTGVATCAGLTVYFLKTAYLDLPEPGSKGFTEKIKGQKQFLTFMATASATAGVYRWYLG